jgi:hypothetical protein
MMIIITDDWWLLFRGWRCKKVMIKYLHRQERKLQCKLITGHLWHHFSVLAKRDTVFNILLLDFLKRMCSYVGPGPWEKMDFFNIICLIWQVNK